jgi:putative flippase GtrA
MNSIIFAYRKLHENTRMVLTAIIGALLGLITYEIIYFLNPIVPKASSSWFIASTVNIARQHGLHRWLTFHSYKTKYWESLIRAYIMYSGSLFFSVGVNWLLTEVMFVNHRIAWVCCLIITALISFFFLKRYVFKTI